MLCLVRKDNICTTYLYKDSNNNIVLRHNDKDYILLPNLQEFSKVKFIQLDYEPKLYFLHFDNQKVIGTLTEIENKLTEQGFDITDVKKILRFLLTTTKKLPKKRLYFSPGFYLSEKQKKVITVSSTLYKPGYLADIDNRITFKPVTSEQLVANGSILIKNILSLYDDPETVAKIIAFSLIAPFKIYFVNKFNLFPLLIIRGRKESGKSLLLDLIKNLFGIKTTDPVPTTEYNLRVLLSMTTLPALLNEGNMFIEELTKNEKLLELITTMTTTNVIKFQTDKNYRGLYLAMRTLIVTTNRDINLPEYLTDKILVMEVNKPLNTELIKKRNIKTPRMFTSEDKKALMAFTSKFYEIFSTEFFGRYYNEMKYMSRNELLNSYINIPKSILDKMLQTEKVYTKPSEFVEATNGENVPFKVIRKGDSIEIVPV
jgi:hypothetical protein